MYVIELFIREQLHSGWLLLKLMSDEQLKSISYEILTGKVNGLFRLKQMFMQRLPRDTNNYLK